MKLYKLTNARGQTMYNTQWGKNVTHTADGKSCALCNDHWLHAYTDPVLAVLMNHVHADIDDPLLWKCEGDVGLANKDKVGCTKLTTLRRIALPRVTNEQRKRFALLAALAVYPLWETHDADRTWKNWADASLAGKTSSTSNAKRNAAHLAHAYFSTYSVRVAACAAVDAVHTVDAAAGLRDGYTKRETELYAASTAVNAADAADAAGIELDLVKLAHEAVESTTRRKTL